MRASPTVKLFAEHLEDRVTPAVGFALVAGNTLATFNTINTESIANVVSVTGLGLSENLVGIDVRPQDGQLYGLTTDLIGRVRLYTINTQSGAASAISSTPVNLTDSLGNLVPIIGSRFEIDFNPPADRLRVVTDTGLNLRINPNNGALVDGDSNPLNGITTDGSINGFGVTGLSGTAYTNNVGGATLTTQYTIDITNSAIFIQNPPNNGNQTLPVPLITPAGLTISSIAGFDISAEVAAATGNTPVPAGQGYVYVTGQDSSGAVAGLATVNLVTGQLGPIRSLGGITNIIGIALQPKTAAPSAFVPLNGNSPITIQDSTSGAQFQVRNPLEGFGGAVDVAVGDFDGDGTADLFVSAGAGGGPRVVVISGATGAALADFFVFDANFSGGVNLAVGDVNGDSRADIVVGAGAGGGPNVRVFDAASLALIVDTLVFEENFRGGVSVAVGNVSGNSAQEIIAGAGAGGGPRVRVFDAISMAPISDFFAYDSTFTGGVNVAAGDVTGDGVTDIITGAGPGGGPNVRVYRGGDLALASDFFAYDFGFQGGVNVGAGKLSNSGRIALLTGTGPTGGSLVRGFDLTTATTILDQFLFDANVPLGAQVS